MLAYHILAPESMTSQILIDNDYWLAALSIVFIEEASLDQRDAHDVNAPAQPCPALLASSKTPAESAHQTQFPKAKSNRYRPDSPPAVADCATAMRMAWPHPRLETLAPRNSRRAESWDSTRSLVQ